MSNKKRLRLIATIMIEVETDLDKSEAFNEFNSDCDYSFKDTENVKVIQTDWRETEIASVLSNI